MTICYSTYILGVIWNTIHLSPQGYASVNEFKTAILEKKDNVAGGLIDSYVAGEYQEDLAESFGLKVATVFDHQFAYGFAISNTLNDNDVERCMRRALSTMESNITSIIQKEMKALPVRWTYLQFLEST